MIQQALQDRAFLVYIVGSILCGLVVTYGLILAIKEILDNKWRLERNRLIVERETRAARLAGLSDAFKKGIRIPTSQEVCDELQKAGSILKGPQTDHKSPFVPIRPIRGQKANTTR